MVLGHIISICLILIYSVEVWSGGLGGRIRGYEENIEDFLDFYSSYVGFLKNKGKKDQAKDHTLLLYKIYYIYWLNPSLPMTALHDRNSKRTKLIM